MLHRLSSRSAKTLVELARKAGFDVERLVEGLPFAHGGLGQFTTEVDWADYIELLHRLEVRAGGPEAFDALHYHHGPALIEDLVALGRLFADSRTFLRFLCTVMFPPITPMVRTQYADLPDGRGRMDFSLVPGAEPSATYFRQVGVILKRLVESKTGSAPTVEAEIGPRAGTFVIEFPDAATGEPPAGWMEVVADQHAVTPELEPEVVERLEEELGKAGASLVQAATIAADGSERIVCTRGLRAGTRAAALVLRGRAVGWVRYNAPADAVPGVQEVLNRIAPAFVTGKDVAKSPVVSESHISVALRASLDTSPDAALLVTPEGQFTALNASGDSLLGSSRADELLERIRAALAGGKDAAIQVHSLDDRGLAGQRLVFLRGTGTDAREHVERARTVWRLTPRQAQVLTCIARGLSNKEIARSMACAEVTIEQHVTQLFRKAGVHGRTALVARLWALVA